MREGEGEGEGERLEFTGQGATFIATHATTGGELCAAMVTGEKGATSALHRYSAAHECLVVMAGVLDLQRGEQLTWLTPGDFASIPAGTVHGYTMRGHRTSLLMWSVGGETVAQQGDTEFVQSPAGTQATAVGSQVPVGIVPYTLEAGEGERMLTGDQLFVFLANNTSTGGSFISLTTQGPRGERIPKHFHEKHTENFFCLEGRMTMWVGDEEIELHTGDFVHAPPGTIHAYRLDGPHNNFPGVLTPGIFEPFFRTLCDPYEGYFYPATPPPVRFDRVIVKLSELDLKLVERPGPRPA